MVLTFCSSAAMSVNGSLGCKALSQKKTNNQFRELCFYGGIIQGVWHKLGASQLTRELTTP